MFPTPSYFPNATLLPIVQEYTQSLTSISENAVSTELRPNYSITFFYIAINLAIITLIIKTM